MAAKDGTFSQLKAFLRDHPGEPTLLLVRSRPAGHQVLERLAREGFSWANVRVQTPSDLALELAAPVLARRGRVRASAIQTLYLVDELVRSGRAGASLWGRSQGDDPQPDPTDGMVRAIHRSLMELRRHGIGARELERAPFSPPAKGEALAGLLDAYQARLDQLSLVDGPGILYLAVEELRRREATGGAGAQAAWILVLQPASFQGLERELVERLARGRQIPVEVQGNGPQTIRFFHAAGPEAELRAILRRVVAGRLPLDQVEVVATDVGTYGEALHALAARLNLPVTFGEGLAIAHAAPGRGALAYLEWIGAGYPAGLLAAALAAGDLVPRSRAAAEEEGPAPEGAVGRLLAHRLLETGIGWGRERYGAWVKRQRAIEGSERPRPEKELDRPLALFLEELLGFTPEEAAGREVSMAAMAAALRRVVTRFTVERSPLDRGGRAALLRTLEGLERIAAAPGPAGAVPGAGAAVGDLAAQAEAAAAGEGAGSLARVAGRLREWIGGMRVGQGEPRPGALHLASLEQGGFAGRPHVFVVGLDEGRFPGKGSEDPLLLDGDRARLPGELPRSGERLSARRQSLDELARRVGGSLTCSFTSRDPLDGDEVAPSPALLDLFRQATGQPHADYSALREALGTPEGVVPPGDGLKVPVLDGSEGWLAAMRVGLPGAERLARPGAGLARAFPLLAAGQEAEAARDSRRLTAYDGLVGQAPDLDPRRTGHPVSAGRLETLAGCPLRYFFRYVLDLSPPERPHFDPDRWLDPLQRGSLLHEIYRRFLEERMREGRAGAPVEEADRARMEVIARSAIEGARQEVPPPSEATFERERQDLLEEARFFVELEAHRASEAVPVLLERAFGMEGEPPVELELPGEEGAQTLHLLGRIDRVDRLPDGSYAVWDYKTGSPGRYESQHTYLDRGRQLQHVLYAWAAEAILRRDGVDDHPRVSRSGYLMTTRRGRGQPLDRPQDPDRREEARNLMKGLLEVAAAGIFAPAPDAGRLCDSCDYRPACSGPQAIRQIAEKAEAGEERLAFWEEVRRYE